MSQKISPIKFWRELSRAALLRFGLAAFLLFSALGLVSILIDSSVRVFPWPFVIVQAIAAGGLPASILVLGRRRWWIALLLVLFWSSIMVLNGSGISFVFSDREGLRVHLGGVIRASDDAPVSQSGIALTAEELDGVYVQRGIIGAFVIAQLVTGYMAFISVIRGEIRRRSRLEAEVRIAQEIQQSLLPHAPFESLAGAVYGITLPAGEVGGDYYDIIALADGRVALAIADVTGHGVGAGILSAMTKSALHLQLTHECDPESVLSHLNKVIYDVSDEKTFVTFAYALIDPARKIVTLATAGHPPILHREETSRHVTALRSRHIALGMRQDASFRESLTVRYSEGDLLLMYTDGLLEAANASGEQFNERLPQTLSRAEGSPQDILMGLLGDVRRFAGNNGGFDDDISLVCMRLKEGTPV